MSRREVKNQCSQHNHKSIDRIRQTVLLWGYWYTKDQLFDNTKKCRSKPKKRQNSQKDNLITIKKGKKRKQKKRTKISKEQMKTMTKKEKLVIKTME